MMPPALSLWLLLMGPVMASFFAALADRLRDGRPLLAGRSSCAACGRTLAARDLVPLLAWPALGGRCRTCTAPIPVRLWLAELAGLALAAVAIWRAGTPVEAVLGASFLLLLLGLWLTDRACLRLPDALTAPLLVAGAGLGLIERGPAPTLLAAALGPAALWLVAQAYRRARGREGLGLGDVKMMAGLGAATGPLALPWITLVAALSALSLAAAGRLAGRPTRATDRVAFGCHLAVAGGLVWALSY